MTISVSLQSQFWPIVLFAEIRNCVENVITATIILSSGGAEINISGRAKISRKYVF